MLLLFESTTSWASVLAWLPDAPPNIVPFGNVTVCGFCSSGRCIETVGVAAVRIREHGRYGNAIYAEHFAFHLFLLSLLELRIAYAGPQV